MTDIFDVEQETEQKTVLESNEDILVDKELEPEFIAKISGQELKDLPKDLYIPPDALEVILETFEGPLDLLLYLIRKQDLDILNIPIAEITKQYLHYIKLMEAFRFELAAEYLLMAATLAEIKSRMLLPRPKSDNEDDEVDPRAELVRRLQEYERFKAAAMGIDELPRHNRDTFDCVLDKNSVQVIAEQPPVSMQDLMYAMISVMSRIDNFAHHHITQEPLTLRERMTKILDMLSGDDYVQFEQFFDLEEGKPGVVVTFMAVLELCREQLIELMQNQTFSPIYIRSKSS